MNRIPSTGLQEIEISLQNIQLKKTTTFWNLSTGEECQKAVNRQKIFHWPSTNE